MAKLEDTMGITTNEVTAPVKKTGHDLVLRIRGTEHDGKVVRLSAVKCSIGSGAGCTLRLCGPGIDALHCLILRGPRRVVIRSCSSKTRLNGEAFAEADLCAGDCISIGCIELEVVERPSGGKPGPPPHGHAAPSESPRTLEPRERRYAGGGNLYDQFQAAEFAAEALDELQEGELQEDELQQTEGMGHDSPWKEVNRQLNGQLEQLSDEQEQERNAWNAERTQLQEELAELREQASQSAAPPDGVDGAQAEEERVALQEAQLRLKEQLSKQHQNFQAEREQWQQDREQLQAELRQDQDAGDEADEFPSKAEPSVADDSAAWQAARELLQSELEELRHVAERNLELEQQLETSRNEATAGRDEADQLRDEAVQLREDADQLRERLADKEREQEQLQTQAESLGSDLKRAEAVLDDRANQLDEASQQLARDRDEFSQTKMDWARQREEAEQQLVEMRDELVQRDQELAAHYETREAQLNAANSIAENSSDGIDDPVASLESDGQADSNHQRDASTEQDDPTDSHIDSGPDAGSGAGPNATVPWSVDQLASRANLDDENPFSASEEPDDIAFRSAEDSAPQSTAEILARMGHAVDADAAIGVGATPSDDSQASQQVDQESPAWNPAGSEPTGDSSSAEDADDASIEEYMSHLLKRVRGDDDGYVPVPREETPVEQPSLAADQNPLVANGFGDAEIEDDKLRPDQFVPRRSAPEETSNLAAMRELANNSARSAISVSDKKRGRVVAKDRLAIAFAAALIGIVMLALSESFYTLTTPAALGLLAFSVVWGFRAVTFRKQKEKPTSARQNRLVDESADRQKRQDPVARSE